MKKLIFLAVLCLLASASPGHKPCHYKTVL